MIKSIGLDVGKEEIAVSVYDGKKHRECMYKNIKGALKRMVRDFRKEGECRVTMEVTGTYHLKCAYMLYDNGFDVRVENPLVIKRFGELQLRRAKTDKADARLIAMYGMRDDARKFNPVKEDRMLLRILVKEIDQLHRDINKNISRIDSLNQYPVKPTNTIRRLEKKNKAMRAEIKEIEKEIDGLINKDEDYKATRKRLQTIQGIGNRLSAAIVAFMGNYEDFESSKQVASFIGITPTIKQSGSSLNSKGGISKMGNKYIRSLLFNCGRTAIVHNKQCRALNKRMEEKGKTYNERLIAAGHKLLRQSFGVIKNNRDYDPEYVKVM